MQRHSSHDHRSEEFFEESTRPPRRVPPGEIVFADDSFVVVTKASGVWAEPGTEDEPGVTPLLIKNGYFDDEESIRPVYPVEPAISGLVLYARDEKSEASLLEQATGGEMVLNCLAIVRGHVMQEEGVLDGPVPQRLKTGPALSFLSDPSAPPNTHWKLRDSFVGFALLECRPVPPLPLVVRTQLQSAALPLAVDSIHGGGQELMLSSFKAGYHRSHRREERPLIARPTLHAANLSFAHPKSREAMRFEAPLPKDMKATLHQLDRFGRIPK